MPRQVVPLLLGWEVVPRSVSVRGAPGDELLIEPVPGVLVEADTGWVLLDTGFDPALVRDADLRQRFYRANIRPVLPNGVDDPLVEACNAAGVALNDITLVALSHLHYDHAGGLGHFATRNVRVAVQRAELDFALNAQQHWLETNGILLGSFDPATIDWWLLDGDAELADGLQAISTPGHTPGHQSFLIEAPGSLRDATASQVAAPLGLALAFDAADLAENLEHELPPGVLVGGSAATAVQSIQKLKSLAKSRGLRLVPGHDPKAWPVLVSALGASLPPLPL